MSKKLNEVTFQELYLEIQHQNHKSFQNNLAEKRDVI